MSLEPEMRTFLLGDTLVRRGEDLCSSYSSADPFPHAVLDNFFPSTVVQGIVQAVGSPDSEHWIRRDNPQSLKRGCSDELAMDPMVQGFLHTLNSGPFLRFLEALTGIEGLVGDPYFQGGGLHQIETGGFLKIHADFNYHEKLKLDRRLNLLLYLNEGWESSWGGDLELWDQEMKVCVQRIAPLFNRCVVFTTTDESFHGHPVPLACPLGVTRKSIALYYYSNGRPAGEENLSHGTLYRTRPGENASGVGLRTRVLKGIRAWTPPVVLQAARAMTARRKP